jgi:VIT1/CCC1 family predicted Fe2+/Mn2+ transporter
VVYENGHGLQELAKHQKKIKEDKRRIELTLETVSTKLSETIEAKALVEQAFLKLKEETGLLSLFAAAIPVLTLVLYSSCSVRTRYGL